MAETYSSLKLRSGDEAPGFTLPDARGKSHTRAAAAGEHGLLVVFACNHCPYVVHVADALGLLAAEFATSGIGTVAINSSDLERYPQDGPVEMVVFATAHGWGFPYLLDESQRVARAYEAACTPDFFLLDAAGRVFYAGQFDETRPGGGQPAHAADLREAARRMLAGEGPLPQAAPSCGCNIKWKPGNEPE